MDTTPIDLRRWARHEARMRRVIDHVYAHLDESLDLNTLADISCLSPHHWHRVYHAMVGETLANTVKRLRLHRAAGQLVESTMSVDLVAAAAGYPNLHSFTRTFKEVYGLPPARFRASGKHREFDPPAGVPSGTPIEVTICRVDALPALVQDHRGSYMAIGQAFDTLFGRVASAGLARPGMRMFGMFLDDPTLVPENALRARAALSGCAEQPPDSGLVMQTLPEMRCAVLIHTGPYAAMGAAYRWLFGHWLPQSGLEAAAGPVIEEYLDSPRDTAPADLRTRIYLPLTGDANARARRAAPRASSEVRSTKVPQ